MIVIHAVGLCSPGGLNRDHVDVITDIGGRMPANRL
jgi:hypothetical protein